MNIEQVQTYLRQNFPTVEIKAVADSRNIVTLSGSCESWQQLVDIGHGVAKLDGVKNVVSDMTVQGMELPKKDYGPLIEKGEKAGKLAEADVVVVGLGIVGCAIARELSKYNLNIVAIDMAEDVATGASKANNGGVHHAGGVKPGTLKAKLSVRGNRMYDRWAQELGFDFVRSGDLLYVEDPDDIDELCEEFKIALKNGDYRPQLVDGAQAMEIEPNLAKYNRKPVMGLWLPSQGRVHTYEVAVALIENAAMNGVRVFFECSACKIYTENGQVTGILTDKGRIDTKYIINAAGVYSDDVSAMAGDRCFTIHPRRGTLAIMDKSKKPMFEHLTGHFISAAKQKRNPESKGGGMEFTPSGNILIGPSATERPDKEDVETTREDLDFIMKINENPDVSEKDIIRIFAGTRPADFSEDFVIGMSPIAHRFINAGAIQSPGVGASPAIAEMVENIVKEDAEKSGHPLQPRADFNPIRPRKVRFAELSREEQDELIRKNPAYGRIVCRCETITEGEILDAIHSPVVPTTIDAIKRRTRAGMGRCQGGFCQAKVLEILARELGKKPTEITLHGKGSNILDHENRAPQKEENA